MNFRAPNGTWQPINEQLVAQPDGSVANTADDFTVSLPAISTGVITASQGGASVGQLMVGAATVPAQVKGSTSTYPSIYPNVDAVFSVRPDTLSQTLQLASANVPTSFASVVTVPTGYSLRAAQDRSVTLLDAAGKVAGMFPAPVMTDSSRDPDLQTSTAVSYAISGASPSYTITVTPDRAWLNDKARVFPVLLDPTVVFGTSLDLGCTAQSTSATLCSANTGTDNTLLYGSTAQVRRIYLNFGDVTGTGSAVPADATISNAVLTMTEQSASFATAMDSVIYRPTAAWTSAMTWATQPAVAATQQDRVSITPPGVGSSVTFNPTDLVQGWVRGTVPNYGLQLRLFSEVSSNTLAFYGLANATAPPTLSVTWSSVVGQQPFVGAYDHKLSDRADLHVDLADRNLVINGTDESMAAPGQSLVVRRTYNSLSAAAGLTGAFGPGWTMNGGVDTGILIGRDQITYTQPGGALARFVRDFAGSTWLSAAGINADLVQVDSTHYSLTYHKSKIKLTFTLPTSTSTTGWLSKSQDGSGNATVYASSGTPLVTTSITDTTGVRSVGFTYTGGVVTAMAETLAAGATGARSWSYGYTSGNLTTYTDPAGKVTRYCYTGALITRMVTAHGNATGATCATTAGTDVTNIAYDATGHVTSVSYQNGGAALITVGFSASTPLNPGGTSGVTTETDPYSKTTQYTFDTSDRITKTTGPLGYPQTATFNTNNDVTASVSATNYTGGGSDPSVTSTFTGEDLTKVSTPTGAAISASYTLNQPAHVSSDRDQSAGNTTSASSTAYSYNSAGQISSTATGTSGATIVFVRHQGDSGVANCGPAGAAAYTGAVCETRDADYSLSFTARHRTLFSYNALGQVVSVTPAQPDNSRTTPPASTFLYDGQSRLTQITDARGNVTAYTYDTLDRRTRTTYQSTDYTAYTYDEDGDQLTVQDYTSGGTAKALRGDTLAYDNLNRLISETAKSRSAFTQTWDANSRLLTSTDAGGTGSVTYGYNDDGALTSMSEPGGDCTGYSLTTLPPASKLCILFAVDKSGNRLRTVFPGDFAEQNQTYDTAGNLVTITATGQASGSATTFYSYTYSNLISSVHTGHISSRTDAAGNHDDYVYTNEGRLSTITTKTSGGTITGYRLYCYDANGNRTSTSTTSGATCPGATTYTYDGANQQLGTGTGFDLSGDETSMTTALPAPATSRVSTWTESQQLATAALNGGTALANTYYDAGNNNLILTDTGGGNQDELRNAPLGIGRVANASGNVHPERDPSGIILGYRTGTGVHYYPMTDNLGSILVVTDATGNAADTYSYDPFGVQTTITNTYPQSFGYTGAYTNTGTGLVHLGARFYDPTQGRFTQPDPTTHPTDPNQDSPYPYASNDPINHVDPSGQFSWTAIILTTLLGLTAAIVCGGLTAGLTPSVIGAFIAGGACFVITGDIIAAVTS